MAWHDWGGKIGVASSQLPQLSQRAIIQRPTAAAHQEIGDPMLPSTEIVSFILIKKQL
ncbi:MAG: hypothetical protein RBS43_06070 [Candidatus Cloacimonas sp.]|nr:hypothetical protein [Candidatus Cloacimonas sp.]